METPGLINTVAHGVQPIPVYSAGFDATRNQILIGSEDGLIQVRSWEGLDVIAELGNSEDLNGIGRIDT